MRLREIPGVKKVIISSGIRYDLVIADDSGYLEMICDHHVSGHLEVAPEHVKKNVTDIMNKPDREVFNQFCGRFEALQKGKKKRQYLLPYLMAGHPGCSIEDMVELAEFIRDTSLYTEQVQDFTPTPMTLSTCIPLDRLRRSRAVSLDRECRGSARKFRTAGALCFTHRDRDRHCDCRSCSALGSRRRCNRHAACAGNLPAVSDRCTAGAVSSAAGGASPLSLGIALGLTCQLMVLFASAGASSWPQLIAGALAAVPVFYVVRAIFGLLSPEEENLLHRLLKNRTRAGTS